MRTLVLALAAAGLAAAQSRTVDRTFNLSPTGRLTLETQKGEGRITGWDQPKVEIHAVIEDDGSFGIGADPDAVKKTEIDVLASSDSVRIRTDYSRAQTWGWCIGNCSMPRVQYTIRMPRTARLTIRDHRSRIEVDNLAAGVDLNTHRGEARLRGVAGDVQIETHRGTVRAELSGVGRTRIDTHRGDVEMRIPRNAKFEVRADLGRHADFFTDFQLTSRRERDAQAFRGAVNGGGPDVVIRSERGVIRLRGA